MVSFQNNLFGLENHRHILYNDIEIGVMLFDKVFYYVYVLGSEVIEIPKNQRNEVKQLIAQKYFDMIDLHVNNYRKNLPYIDELPTREGFKIIG
jgi:hypothetical protein